MTDNTFNDYRELLEEHLLDFIPDVDHKSITLYESMKYSLSAGGKRIRPVLLLAACDFCGGSPERRDRFLCKRRYGAYFSGNPDRKNEIKIPVCIYTVKIKRERRRQKDGRIY